MPQYTCHLCNYSTKLKGDYNKHLKTKKHLARVIESNLKSTSMVMNQNEPQMNQNEPAMNQNEPAMNQNEPAKKMYKCNYCEETFTTIPSRRRHELHRCKYNDDVMMKLMDEKDKYIKKIEYEKKEMERERKQLYKKIDELISKVGNTYNQNIILNNYGSEDLSHISDQFKTQLLKVPYMMIPKMIEEVHFSDKKPENKNIAITNKKENRLKVFKNGKWEYQNKKEVINELVDSKYFTLDNHFEENKSELNNFCKGNYLQFKEYMNTEDKEFVDKLSEECENVLLNNR
jgi:hypothetical protein